MKGLNVGFYKNDGEKIVIDVLRAAAAGAREIEITYCEQTNNIQVEVRKKKKTKGAA